ncbi:MAG: tRNA (N6-isopentenyl adenosine(37)-C2)-methylthiotransferase MiaB [Candidatus Neomarinimicrobiota bacterium]
MNKKYYIETFGCQMNVADSELVAGILQREGYGVAENISTADIILVNTCAIRDHAEEKVHSRLGFYDRIKQSRPHVVVGVLGCMAQNLKAEILESKPFVDIVLGPDSYRRLPELLRDRNQKLDHIVDTTLSRFEVYDNLFPSRQEGINAWISIMRGCDKFCTFCIVPFTRGRERSRSLEDITAEIKAAVKLGFLEVTLLGQNVNSYTHENVKFHHLLAETARIKGLKRLRYTSPHPQDMTEEVIDVMAGHDNICRHVHLPLQAGNNRILRKMNRTYTKEQYLDQVVMIRERLPAVSITTDIMVGFPGESKTEFEDTLLVMNAVRFDSAYTFKFSPRPGTKALEYGNQVSPAEMQDRLDQIIRLQKQHTLERNLEMVGRTELVLVEKESKKSSSQWAGRTDNNKWVIFDRETVKVKDLVQVKIQAARGVTLHGKIVEKLEEAA